MKIKKTLVFISMLILLIVSLILFNTTKTSQVIRTKAQVSDADFCQTKCKEPMCRGLPDFYDGDCCAEIQRTGDPMACPWPQRGWCMPEHCDSIPGDVDRQRCGGPRYVYCEMDKAECQKKGCFTTPTVAPTIIPTAIPTTKPTIIPTAPVVATTAPTIQPTSPPVYRPTATPIPYRQPTTIINPFIPIETPYPTPEPEFSIPQFRLPRFNIFVNELNQTTRKPLGFFEYLVNTIRSIDRQLEEKINEEIGKILK